LPGQRRLDRLTQQHQPKTQHTRSFSQRQLGKGIVMAPSAEGNGSTAPSAENPDPDRSADLDEEHLEVENGEPDATRPGRPPATSAEEIARIALLLFDERGFDDTTVDDIARAAGIGRRTFFRYFTSKNEVPWGDFDGELRRMRDWLRAAPVDQPAASVLHDAILGFNRYPEDELIWHRKRMALILRTPALQAYSTLR